MDFKTESLRAGRTQDKAYTVPEIPLSQQHLLLKYDKKLRRFYTFHVSEFCTQCPLQKLLLTCAAAGV